MHELAICQAIMNQVESLAREHHAKRIRTVSVQIGPLSGIEPHLMELAFPMVSTGTVAEGSRLVILQPEIRVRCPKCDEVNQASPLKLACPSCGHWRTELLSGDEMLLASVEMSRG